MRSTPSGSGPTPSPATPSSTSCGGGRTDCRSTTALRRHASSAPTPEESFINLQQRTQIEHYLERLTPRYRQLVRMRFFEEYSYEEIAAKLALPLGTVKTQIHRAREQMCRMISEGEKH